MDPRIVIDVLVELGQNEERLAELRAEARRDEKRRRDARELAAEYGTDAAEADADGRRAESELRQADRELRTAESELSDKRDRLVGVTDRRQHRALLEEIAALERRIGKLEMAGLEAIVSADVAQETSDQAGRDAEHAGRRAPDEDPDGDCRRDEAVAELEAEIVRLTGLLPPDAGGHVQRLRRRGDRAVAWGDKGTCTGCFSQMPPQHGIAVECGRQAIRCASCARYVVHRPWR